MRLTRTSVQVMMVSGLLLVIAASRAPYFDRLELDAHEAWTMWQAVGSPAEIIQRTPFDWGPLYYLVLGGWQALVGTAIETGRSLSLLWFTLGTAFVYRSAQRLRPGTAAYLGMLVYAVPAGVVYLSINIRGYAMLLALLPLAFWLTLRYFESDRWIGNERGRLGTPLLLVVTLAAMVYIHPTAVMGCAALGLYTVVAYPRRLMRWLPVGGGLAIALLPELQMRLDMVAARMEDQRRYWNDPAIPLKFWVYYTGPLAAQQIAGLAVSVLGVGMLLRHNRQRSGLALMVVTAAAYSFMIGLGWRFGFNGERHNWWMILPTALLVAWGLSYLPRSGLTATFGLLLAGLLVVNPPGRLDESGLPNPVFGDSMAWMARHFRVGDVVILDRLQQCSTFADEWDYYLRRYFPQGWPAVTEAGDQRRVWYISADGWEKPELKAAIRAGREASIYHGPWDCLFRLYVAPPDPTGELYENGMRFHGYEIIEGGQPTLLPAVRREGEAITVRLWWSVDRPPPADYSVGLHLYDEKGNLAAQSDSAPQLVHLDPNETSPLPPETSRWQPGKFYVEERTLHVPDDIPWRWEGTHPYTLGLIVYQFWDNTRLTAAGVNREGVRLLQGITVRAW